MSLVSRRSNTIRRKFGYCFFIVIFIFGLIFIQNIFSYRYIEELCNKEGGLFVFQSTDVKSITWNTYSYYDEGNQRYVLRPEDGSGKYTLMSNDIQYKLRVHYTSKTSILFPQVYSKISSAYTKNDDEIFRIVEYGHNNNLFEYYLLIPGFPVTSKYYYSFTNYCGAPFSYDEKYNNIEPSEDVLSRGRFFEMKRGLVSE